MLSLAERLKNRGADSEAIAAMSTETKKKIKKRKTSLPFSKSTFLLSSTYTGSAKKKLVGLIKKHGGTVARRADAAVTFFVQGHNDDCDDRIARCLELGMTIVPPEFLRASAEAETLLPIRSFFADGHANRSFPLLKFCGDDAVGDGRLFVAADFVAREYEEVNQGVNDYMVQAWPTVGAEGRHKLYLLPVESFVAGLGPPLVDLMGLMKAFLEAYFQTAVQVLESGRGERRLDLRFEDRPSGLRGELDEDGHSIADQSVNLVVTTTTTTGSSKAARRKRSKKRRREHVEEVGVRAVTNTLSKGKPPSTLLSALDLLDGVHLALPDDAYAILGVTSHRIYENEPDGNLLGRAFGGSRIAVFSTAALAHAAATAARGRKKKKTSDDDGGSRDDDDDQTWAEGIQRWLGPPTHKKTRAKRVAALAYQLATTAHETLHCYGLDHCGFFRCCMNSWSDRIVEFGAPGGTKRTSKKKKKKKTSAKKKGTSKSAAGVEAEREAVQVQAMCADASSDEAIGSIHLCPVCVQKLQRAAGFDFAKRLDDLQQVYRRAGLFDQYDWCRQVRAHFP